MGQKRYFRMLFFNFQQGYARTAESFEGAAPIFFGPRTLVRTWGTRPEGMTNGSAAVPFVIPSEAEGSAVHSTSIRRERKQHCRCNRIVIPTGA
jgi:hypothetical protein